MHKQQSGLTLIELIIVIIILGILAATAAPKLLDLTTEADEAAQDAGFGALKSAASIYYAKNRAWPNGTLLAAAMEPVGACASGVITLPDITKTFSVGADCTTLITGVAGITKVP